MKCMLSNGQNMDGPFTIFIFIESGGGSKVVNLMVNLQGNV